MEKIFALLCFAKLTAARETELVPLILASDNAKVTDGMATKTNKEAIHGGSAVSQTVTAIKRITAREIGERATTLKRLCALPFVRRGDLTNFKPY
jgi:hypothetical protein